MKEKPILTEIGLEELDLPSPLRSYQWEGVSFLIRSNSGLLADEMGMGKTVQAAVALQILARSGKRRRILVVCPASLCYQWQAELHRWAPDVPVRRVRGNFEDRRAHFRLPVRLWVASYEQIRQDIDFLSREPPYDLVILDEAQRIKNRDSALALSCRLLPRTGAWALTGTPLENRPDDLVSIFGFLKPGVLHSGLSREEVHGRIAPYFLRRRKRDVLTELPEIILQELMLELGPAQREAYDAEWMIGRHYIRQQHGANPEAWLLAQITKLKLICNFEPDSMESCKLDALKVTAESLDEEGGKLLVFSQFVTTLKEIERRLDELPVEVLSGELNEQERLRVISWFENSPGPRVLLVSLRVGGVGLNLGSASTVILFDRWWNPAVENQAIQRAHRYGRRTPLQVIKFLVLDTVEERIDQIIGEKSCTFSSYIEDAEMAEVKPLTREDLVKILV